ncbi:hypothetical protein [Gracilibacillus timonensis]|uniref:hypothetical protein n=1 Tax=Gracilibacillus timonensis TaxID=1816696 RepID=UPI0008250043|nr:hypothetical protein [Gracilibacillus timonensis]
MLFQKKWVTDSTMEFGHTKNKYDYFVDEWQDKYKIVHTYQTNITDENGFNCVYFDHYAFQFSVLAVRSLHNQKNHITLVGETINLTATNIHFNGDVKIITKRQEQTETDLAYAIEESAPDEVVEAFILIPMNKKVPKKFTLEIAEPWEVYLDEEKSDKIGEKIRLCFTKK